MTLWIPDHTGMTSYDEPLAITYVTFTEYDMSPIPKYDPPRDAVETQIATIWAQKLGAPQVGIHDGFTDLGGHSVQAAELVAQIAAQFGLRNVNQELLRLGTVADQAAFIKTQLPR
ncbi:MAG: hypothetical protein KDI55_09020 [Anaerolineae bacterium]|nr:hypothetical protein [Anaerolineae bacterium]